jgi:carbamoyl-phosphate synthase large subunit
MKKFNIAVTGLNATDNPAPGIPVIRSIRHAGEHHGKIIGLGYDAFDTGIYDANLLDEVYLIPYPNEGEGALLERIKEITGRTPLDVLLPTLDSELTNIEHLQHDLNDLGIQVIVPTAEQIRMRSKSVLSEFCKKNGFDVPRTLIVNDAKQLTEVLKKVGTPAIVKGTFYEAYTAYSVEEAVIHFHKIRSKWGLPIIVQDLLHGEEYDVACVGDGVGGLVGAVPMRKLRLTEKGKAWAGVTIRNQKLAELSAAIIRALKWRGPCELEFLRDDRTGKFYLIEINPRFPSWIYLSAGSGTNLPWAAVRLALGQKVKPLKPPEPGISFVRHATDLICPLDYIESLTTKGELVFR